MKIRFLVLSAVICLCAHVASATFAVATGGPGAPVPVVDPVPAPKPVKEEKKPERRVVETDTSEITYTKRKSSHKKDKETKKEVKIIREVIHRKKDPVPKKPKQTCAELTAENKKDCETKDVPVGYKAIFAVKDNAHCDWTCNYEALPTTAGPTTVAPTTTKKKVIKKVSKPKNLKECEGEKKIQFSNCLVKINGLIAWGAQTKNFDKKFEKFLAEAKKPRKKAKKATKPAAKPPTAVKPAVKPAPKPAPPAKDDKKTHEHKH
jgi:hypothetical protein